MVLTNRLSRIARHASALPTPGHARSRCESNTFRGESRFTTWAYRFVILEVSTKAGRHFWRRPSVPMDSEDWERLPDRFGLDPARQSEWHELVTALRRAVDEVLTDRQRRIFVTSCWTACPPTRWRPSSTPPQRDLQIWTLRSRDINDRRECT